MKSSYWGFSLCLIVVLSACGHKPESVETSPGSKAIKVSTIQVSTSENVSDFRYSGSIEPSQTIPLSFQTVGTIENIYVEDGDVVKKGQLLASLNKSDMKNIYQVALSKYEQAKDAYDRLKTVHDEGSLTELKWVEMETGFKQAGASLAIAKSNLDKCDLRAPAEGIIGKRNIEPGQSTIGINLVHIELVEMKTVYVKVSVPENEISRIKKGQKATFMVSALNNKQFEGVVTSINPVAEKISRTYAVKIAVKNFRYDLKPGMVCDVTICQVNDLKTLAVPYKAVSKDKDGNAYVYVVNPDKKSVKKQIVTVGNYQVSEIEILGGLSAGQTIVSEGCEKLSDNMLIRL